MADCQLCGRPQRADVSYACTQCGDTTERSLHRAADHWPDLQDSIARLVRHGDPTPRAGKPAPAAPVRPDSGALRHYADQATGWPSGLVVDLAASETADAVRNTATTWARLVVEERGPVGRTPIMQTDASPGAPGPSLLGARAYPVGPPADTPGLLRWLAGQVGWLRHQPFAAQALDELGELGQLVVRAVDRPAPRVDAGECGAATDTGPCRQRLSASPGAAYVHCPACRATRSAADRRETLLGEARQLRGTATEVAQWLTMLGLPTPAATVRKWAERGRRHGTMTPDAFGRYSFREVEQLRLRQPERRQLARSAA